MKKAIIGQPAKRLKLPTMGLPTTPAATTEPVPSDAVNLNLPLSPECLEALEAFRTDLELTYGTRLSLYTVINTLLSEECLTQAKKLLSPKLQEYKELNERLAALGIVAL